MEGEEVEEDGVDLDRELSIQGMSVSSSWVQSIERRPCRRQDNSSNMVFLYCFFQSQQLLYYWNDESQRLSTSCNSLYSALFQPWPPLAYDSHSYLYNNIFIAHE